MASKFTTLQTIDGYDVVDEDTGRPLDHRGTLREASGVCYYLNGLAGHPEALCRRLERLPRASLGTTGRSGAQKELSAE
jgi:hypothetical protein